MHQALVVPVQKKEEAADLELPRYMTAGSSGMDLLAAVQEPETLAPGERKLIPTGVAVALPSGYELQIRPRSGLAYKQGVTVLNSPGTIDADYRGEIKVILINLGQGEVIINRGDRIAQMILARVEYFTLEERDELPATVRSDGGFGHTG